MGLGAVSGGLRVFMKKSKGERLAASPALQAISQMGRESAAGAGGRNRLAFVGMVVWRPAHTASVYKLLLIVFNNVVLFAFVLPCECNAPEGPAKNGAFCSCRMAQHLVCSNTWERENKSALCPSYSTSSHLSLGCLTALTWLFGGVGGQAQEVQVLLTGAASPSQAPRRHHLHPSACSPCHAGTLYMATGWAAFRWPGQAVQVTALTSQQDLPVQGFVAFLSPSGRTRSPARAL